MEPFTKLIFGHRDICINNYVFDKNENRTTFWTVQLLKLNCEKNRITQFTAPLFYKNIILHINNIVIIN